MKKINFWIKCLLFVVSTIHTPIIFAQTTEENVDNAIDVVYLKNGSKLQGTILSWDLEKGMSFQLLTGATIFLSKNDIEKVDQENRFVEMSKSRPWRVRNEYSFREKGWYQNSSGFLNVSLLSGAGIHHAMGYRFNRLFGVGIGMGIESNDFQRTRNIIPVYAEIRGFLVPKKVSPYYAVKAGYGIALRDELAGTMDAKGGLYLSPELGIRFGAKDVNFYAGLEYKIQNATFTNIDWIWGSGVATDVVSYRRLQLRMGLLF